MSSRDPLRPDQRRAATPDETADRFGISARRRRLVIPAILALLIAAGAAVLLARGGTEEPAAPKATAVPSTETTQPQQQVEAQVNLTPPPSRRDGDAAGVLLIQRSGGQRQIAAAVQGLPRPPAGGYGIWLYTSASKARWLGFFAGRDGEGRLLARSELTAPIEEYRQILVTRESRRHPRRPGPVFLRGRVPPDMAAASG
jgi:hypothetical protein